MTPDAPTGQTVPRLGAVVRPDGTHFRVWAPETAKIELLLEQGGALSMPSSKEGYGTLFVPHLGAGARYRYLLDGRGPFPDPASRRQPEGVHGPSEVVDPASFAWSDRRWPGVSLETLVVYEFHVGTFTEEGTFQAAARRLPALAELGVTAIELMPVAAFPGQRNWGYDGVALFAPASAYGSPDDLRALVDAAHALGIGVILDVVYNHLGPDGNYLGAFSRHYFDPSLHTPWGAALNFAGVASGPVREFFLENAAHWLREYHLDGLRLDATHAIEDRSARHLLAELARLGHALVPRRLVVAEDERNLSLLVAESPGYGLDAVWADDLHHQLRRRLAGDADGYFADFDGTAEDIAATLRRGFFYTGQLTRSTGRPRGTDPAGLPSERFIVSLQNHDQVGNRAFGDRLHHAIAPAAYRAGLALVLLAPETPLLFMGQEWAASTPFQYFTDHRPELARLVTEGRRREFAAFQGFREPEMRERIPDPQAESTFTNSKLRWDERTRPGHAEVLRLHQALLALRREWILPRRRRLRARAAGERVLLLDGGDLAVAVGLEGAGEVELPPELGSSPRVLLSTEQYAPDPASPVVAARGGSSAVSFRRPGAVVLSAI